MSDEAPRKPALPPEVLALLERRAERVRAQPQPLESDGAVWVAEFPLGDARYAVPLEHLRAAVPLRAVAPVPLAPPHVIGILRFHGHVITALSLASLVGTSGWREDPAVLLVVDPGNGRLCAVDCEGIPKPIGIPQQLVAAARAQRLPITPIEVSPDRRVHLLDLPLLLQRPREVRDAG